MTLPASKGFAAFASLSCGCVQTNREVRALTPESGS